MEGNYLSRHKHKENDTFRFEDHHICTSPARNYGCNFCKREFRSAQALGGHMNVHRRDRARLRSALPSWVSSECPKPNPNPTLLSPSSSISPLSDELLPYTPRRSPPLHSPCLTLSPSPSSATSSQQLPILSHQSTRSAFGIEELKGFAEEHENLVFKINNENSIKLELGIGLLKHPRENIDLELRLGHF